MIVAIKFVTDGFVWGADQRTASFRLDSFLGRLRQMLNIASSNSNDDVTADKLLGSSAEGGQGQGYFRFSVIESNIRTEVIGNRYSSSYSVADLIPLDPRKRNAIFYDSTIRIHVGQQPQLPSQSKPLLDTTAEKNRLLDGLKLLGTIGGIGFSNARGFGSLHIKVENNEDDAFAFDEEFYQNISTLLKPKASLGWLTDGSNNIISQAMGPDAQIALRNNLDGFRNSHVPTAKLYELFSPQSVSTGRHPSELTFSIVPWGCGEEGEFRVLCCDFRKAFGSSGSTAGYLTNISSFIQHYYHAIQ